MKFLPMAECRTFSFKVCHLRERLPGKPGLSVVLITVTGMVDEETWPAYRAAYLSAYHILHRFIIVFDVRDVSMPAGMLISQKREMIMGLKPWTVARVVGVCLLTDSEVIHLLVNTLVKAGGQAAPFAIFTSVDEIATWAAVAAEGFMGHPVHADVSPAPVLFGDLDGAMLYSLVLQKFINFMKHFYAAIKQ